MKYLDKPYSTCTETLYRLIYSAPGQNKGWPGLLSLAMLEFGHSEGDSVHFTESKNERHVTTLVERKDRYALGILQPSTRSNAVMTRIKKQFHDQPLPKSKLMIPPYLKHCLRFCIKWQFPFGITYNNIFWRMDSKSPIFK